MNKDIIVDVEDIDMSKIEVYEMCNHCTYIKQDSEILFHLTSEKCPHEVIDE